MLKNTGKLAGRTLFITGASRGIGKAIALKAAADGANVVIAAKTDVAHPKLPGTIYTAAKEIQSVGGKALPCIVDVRDEKMVAKALEEAVAAFGGIDIVVNNASAINLVGTVELTMKKFDLMHQINTRGTYLVSKLSIPHLLKSSNPHILNISPPLNLSPRWFKGHVGYTMAKYGMSMCVLGMAEEYKEKGIACNALWPRTAIITAAMEMLAGSEAGKMCRKPDIMADAAYAILSKDSKSYTGNFAIDDEILKTEGINNFDEYAVVKGEPLLPDFFLDDHDAFLAKQGVTLSTESVVTGGSTGGGAKEGTSEGAVEQVFNRISSHMNADLVKTIQAVYSFEVSGKEPGKWYIDLKEGGGSCGKGEPPTKADSTFKLSSDNFQKMFSGNLKPTTAFMSGKLKIGGDMSKALKLEKLMGQLQSKL